VRRLVVVSFPMRLEGGMLPDVRVQTAQMSAATAEFMKPSPMWELYERTAPRVEDFPTLVGKMGDWLNHDYDYSTDVAALTMPTMLVFGDADNVGAAHIAEFWALLGGGVRDGGWDGSGRPGAHRLAVLPDSTHYTMFTSPALLTAVDDFLG